MTADKEKAKWHTRGLTSLCTLAGFLVMSLTGLVLYIVPQGRIAYWVDWTFLGLTKTAWGDIHILSSIFFVVAGAVHTYFNWRALLNYLRDKAKGTVKLKKEIAVATFAAVVLCVSGALKLPPLGYLLDLNETIKNAWVTSKDFEPPFGHAEEVSLRVFCKKTDIPLDRAVEALEAAGLHSVLPASRLVDISRRNGRSPLELYRHIRHLEVVDSPPGPVDAVFSAEQVEKRFAGSGIGNKSLIDIASSLGLEPSRMAARLKQAGLTTNMAAALKTAAVSADLTPLELLKTALVDDYTPVHQQPQ